MQTAARPGRMEVLQPGRVGPLRRVVVVLLADTDAERRLRMEVGKSRKPRKPRRPRKPRKQMQLALMPTSGERRAASAAQVLQKVPRVTAPHKEAAMPMDGPLIEIGRAHV